MDQKNKCVFPELRLLGVKSLQSSSRRPLIRGSRESRYMRGSPVWKDQPAQKLRGDALLRRPGVTRVVSPSSLTSLDLGSSFWVLLLPF